jgi:hypothetical protein
MESLKELSHGFVIMVVQHADKGEQLGVLGER